MCLVFGFCSTDWSEESNSKTKTRFCFWVLFRFSVVSWSTFFVYGRCKEWPNIHLIFKITSNSYHRRRLLPPLPNWMGGSCHPRDLEQVKRVSDFRPPISTVCTDYASDIVSFLHEWNGTWWCPRGDILLVEASISITTRGLQWCLIIIVKRLGDIPNIIARGLWSYNLMIYWKGLSHDSTILYLTWHLN